MHDLLFANQQSLGHQAYLAFARTLALDLARFTRDLEQETYAPRIREDFMSGVRSGVNGTPTFFINGVRHNGGFDLRSMLDATGDVIRARQPLGARKLTAIWRRVINTQRNGRLETQSGSPGDHGAKRIRTAD